MELFSQLGDESMITSLHVHGWVSEPLFTLLSLNRLEEFTAGLLPDLQELRLRGVNFPVHPVEQHEAPPHWSWDALRKRHEIFKTPIPKVVLNDCYNVTPEVVAGIRSSVDCVEWDGIQQPGMLWEDLGYNAHMWESPRSFLNGPKYGFIVEPKPPYMGLDIDEDDDDQVLVL